MSAIKLTISSAKLIWDGVLRKTVFEYKDEQANLYLYIPIDLNTNQWFDQVQFLQDDLDDTDYLEIYCPETEMYGLQVLNKPLGSKFLNSVQQGGHLG